MEHLAGIIFQVVADAECHRSLLDHCLGRGLRPLMYNDACQDIFGSRSDGAVS